MELTYSARKTGFEKGKRYRNPKLFREIERSATSVVIEGDYPNIAKAYEDAKVPVKVVAAPKKPKASSKASKSSEADERREFLLNEIERITETRPGANTKDETLEKQYAELTRDPE